MEKPIRIPGTLDESGIGYKDVGGKKWHPDTDTSREIYQVDQGIRTRLTRVVTYEGPASITRTLIWDVPAGKRLFVEVERSRHLTLRLNGNQVTAWTEGSVSTPWVFEVTERMTGRDTLEMIADNSYPGWPHDAIVFSSAATDETQTNWNGLMGYVRLRVEEDLSLSEIAEEFGVSRQAVHDALRKAEKALLELEEKISRLQAELSAEQQTALNAEKWVALIKQYANPTELTAELLNTLIEKIVIHEAIKSADGMRDQEIEIYYRFIGKID